jgi:hypothetical protein
MKGKRNICMCATAFRTADMQRAGKQPYDILIGDMFYWTHALENGGTVACAPGHLSNYFFYRPGGSSETNRNSVPAWAWESGVLAERMRALILADPANTHARSEVERVVRKYLSLTVSNQFAWNALRGAAKTTLVGAFLRLAGIVLRNIHAVIRVGGVIVLPRRVLEQRVLAHARRQARAAGRSI